MSDEATLEGADLNTPAPGSVDDAAQKINGLFAELDKPDDEQEPPEGEPEEGDEPEESGEGEPESEDEPEDGGDEQQPLTSLKDLSEKLGVDESSLYDIKLPIKVDGESGEATLSQLVKSFQLEGHLNRKNMEVSDLKKEIQKEKESIEQHRQQRLSDVEQAAQIANQLLLGEYQSIDWDNLKKEDSIGYLEKKAQFEEYRQALGQLAGVIQQDKQQAQQKQQEQFKAYVQEQQNKLRDSVPEWKDEKVLKAQYGELINFLREDFGVTKEELNTILDHRFYLMARDAKRYRDLQKKNPQIENKDRKPSKVVKPGASKSYSEKNVAQVSDLRKRFSKSKDVKSAGALINAMIKR